MSAPICDQWRDGVCMALSADTAAYCPKARALAEHSPCCHHPRVIARAQLQELKAAGLDLGKWRGKLRTPADVARLYSAWQSKRSGSSRSSSSRKRRTTSS